MSTWRLRLSSSRQPYRRGGWKIGPKHAPTMLEPGDVNPGSLLAVLRDPVITVAREIAEDVWDTPSAVERAEAAAELAELIAVEEQRASDREEPGKLAEKLLEPIDPPAPVEPEVADHVAPKGAEPKAASGRKPAAKAKG